MKSNMTQKIEPFYIVGISITATNENKKSVEDMGKLWGRFFSESISENIPNKSSEDIYSVFTDYDSDFTGKYKAILGHKVNSIKNLPPGMVYKKIGGDTYKKIVAKGKMPDAIVDTWKDIWSKDKELKRRYTNDFEVYGPNSRLGDSSEVEIYLAIH
jgi:predicted transcriptional regulator YdeE